MIYAGIIDIGIVLEGKEKADHTVEVSRLDISLETLRKLMAKQCEIDFHYKFINFATGYGICLFFLLVMTFKITLGHHCQANKRRGELWTT